MDSNDLLPPGLTVHGSPDAIAAHFAAIALLQPVALVDHGVACAPRAAPELARRGSDACLLPMTPLDDPPGWPDPPSLTVGSWFLRSPEHIAAPPGFRELVQVTGEGFGAWPHPTTLMCLAEIEDLPDGPAIDLGCGAGLLTQAWAATRGPVTAVDLDGRAISHAEASLAHAILAHAVALHQTPFSQILPTATEPVLLANVPPIAHQEIAAAIPAAAHTLLVSGVRVTSAEPTLAAYAELGFRTARATASGGWGCWVLHRVELLPAT